MLDARFSPMKGSALASTTHMNNSDNQQPNNSHMSNSNKSTDTKSNSSISSNHSSSSRNTLGVIVDGSDVSHGGSVTSLHEVDESFESPPFGSSNSSHSDHPIAVPLETSAAEPLINTSIPEKESSFSLISGSPSSSDLLQRVSDPSHLFCCCSFLALSLSLFSLCDYSVSPFIVIWCVWFGGIFCC